MTILNFSNIKSSFENRVESFINLGEQHGFNQVNINNSDNSDSNISDGIDAVGIEGAGEAVGLLGEADFLAYILIPIFLLFSFVLIFYGIYKLFSFIYEYKKNKRINMVNIKLMKKNKNYFSPLDKEEINRAKENGIDAEILNYMMIKNGYISNYSIDSYLAEFKPEKIKQKRKLVLNEFLNKGIVKSVDAYIKNNKEKIDYIKNIQKSFI